MSFRGNGPKCFRELEYLAFGTPLIITEGIEVNYPNPLEEGVHYFRAHKPEDIQRIVWKLKERNIGILITDHNVQETLSITDRAYLLYDGNILKSGSAEELASDEQVRRVYLGQNFVLRARKE